MEISVVIPAYNEEATITETIQLLEQRLTGLNYTPQQYEIIIVDDGSVDSTPLKIKKYAAANPAIKYIRTPHLGKGNAVKTGLLNAQGKIVGVLDADLEVRLAQPEKLREYINLLHNGVDIIVGSKRHPQTIGEISPVRRLLSIAYNNLAFLFTGIKIKDTQTGLKIINRKVIEKLAPHISTNGFTIDLELLALAQKLGYKIKEIPIKIKLRNNFKIIEILKMAKELIKIVCRVRNNSLFKYNFREQIKVTQK